MSLMVSDGIIRDTAGSLKCVSPGVSKRSGRHMAGTTLPSTDKGLAAYISNVRPSGDRQWLALGNGLALVIEPSGVKTYQGRFRLKGSGQAKRMTLGFHPAMSLADARRRLAEVKGAVRAGNDPSL